MTSPVRRGLLAAGGAAVLTAVLGVAVSAHAAEYTPLTDRYLKTVALKCDPSACYYTWGALDNDKDGVTNADERVAGTDPDDPNSHPGLGEIVELATHRDLPSFEAGMGAFTLTPADVLMAREKAGIDLNNTAFPVLDRKDALTRMGVSGALLTEYGIKLDKDGLSIGLGTGKDKNGLVLPTVSTMASSWYAGGRGGQQPNAGVANGGVLRTFPDAGTRKVTYEYNDGSSKSVDQTGPGTSRHEYFDENGNFVVREDHKEWTEERNGATDVHDEFVGRDEAGNVVGKVVKDTHYSTDGSTSTHTSTTTYVSNGERVVAVYKSESTSIGDSKGGSTESKSQQKCDSSGNQQRIRQRCGRLPAVLRRRQCRRLLGSGERHGCLRHPGSGRWCPDHAGRSGHDPAELDPAGVRGAAEVGPRPDSDRPVRQ